MKNLRFLLSSSRPYLLVIGMLLLGTSAAIVWQPPIVDATLHGDGTHEDPLGIDSSVTATVHYVDSVAASYKVYTALLTQSGTSAPVATVLENTLGGTVVWSRTGTGQYEATLSNAFPANYTPSSYYTWFTDIDAGGMRRAILSRATNSTISLLVGTSTDGTMDDILSDTFIEIRVYN